MLDTLATGWLGGQTAWGGGAVLTVPGFLPGLLVVGRRWHDDDGDLRLVDELERGRVPDVSRRCR